MTTDRIVYNEQHYSDALHDTMMDGTVKVLVEVLNTLPSQAEIDLDEWGWYWTKRIESDEEYEKRQQAEKIKRVVEWTQKKALIECYKNRIKELELQLEDNPDVELELCFRKNMLIDLGKELENHNL